MARTVDMKSALLKKDYASKASKEARDALNNGTRKATARLTDARRRARVKALK